MRAMCSITRAPILIRRSRIVANSAVASGLAWGSRRARHASARTQQCGGRAVPDWPSRCDTTCDPTPTGPCVTLDDVARELNPKVRGWLAYYGRYTRSALYPMARYINQTLAIWLKWKYKRFHRRLGRARLFLAKIARENRRLFVHWQLGEGDELA